VPRIRAIKPETFQSETLAEVSIAAERTFVGLWTQADDMGRLKNKAAVLNGQLWPLRPEHTIEHMKEDIAALIGAGALCAYTVDGVSMLHVTKFNEHQVINRRTKSKLPCCPEHPEEEPAAGRRKAGNSEQLTLDQRAA
jgi:hypothetical protein